MSKTWMITGASKGLGHALALFAQAQGDHVIALARNASSAFDDHTQLVCMDLDLTDTDTLSQKIQAIFAHPFCVDAHEIIVVNNAGQVEPIGQIEKLEPAYIAQALQLNLHAPILISQAALQKFTHKNLRIVSISSGAAVSTIGGWSVYGASKAGLDHFMRHLVLQVTQQPHVKACSLYPGVIDTDMQSSIRQSSAQDFPDIERFKALKTEGMLQSKEDTAQKIYRFILSPAFGTEPVVDIRSVS